MSKLTEKECTKAQAILHEYKDYPDEVDGDDISWAVSVFAELIYHHFDNQAFELQLTRDECELIVDALKPWEEELGWDVTLLIEKIEEHKSLLPRGEGVVDCVEFD